MQDKTLQKRFQAYLRAYLPQWQPKRAPIEPEYALLMAMATLLEDANEVLQRLPQKHEEEFLNSFGGNQHGESPAAWSFATFSAPYPQILPDKSVFYANGDGKRLWTTQEDIWAEPCRPTMQILSSGFCGKLLCPCLPSEKTPTRVFDFRGTGEQLRQARFPHPDIFASCSGCDALLTLSRASARLLTFLTDRQAVTWFLEGTQGEQTLDTPQIQGQSLHFHLPANPDAQALLVRVSDGFLPPDSAAGAVLAGTDRPVASESDSGLPCVLAVTDEGTYSMDHAWFPFGEEPEPWRTCQIACPDALCLRGASITVRWEMTLREKETEIPGFDQPPEYKLIMRSLPPTPPEVREVYVDAVVWEYWNGGGWRTLPGTENYLGSFGASADTSGYMTAKFVWPKDAAPYEQEGVNTYWLRWRVRSMEGTGWLPRRVYAPVITRLCFSASLENASLTAEHFCGLGSGSFVPVKPEQALFPPITGEGNDWWLGFEPPPMGTYVNLYLSVQGQDSGRKLYAWEAVSADTERALSLEDGTDGLTHDGILRLNRVTGVTTVRFGRRCWWLCLREEKPSKQENDTFPLVKAVLCGAVRIWAEHTQKCSAGEKLQPLRGGIVSGVTRSESFGGTETESERDRLTRIRARRHHMGRAVSSVDIEQVLRDEFRDVVHARCVRQENTENTMDVGILMRDVSRHAAVFALRQEDILRTIQEKTVLPTLGMQWKLREAEFYLLHVTVWVLPAKGAWFDEINHTLLETLKQFLHPVTGNFHGGGWRLGCLPTLTELRNCLQAAAVHGVVVKLSVTAVSPQGLEQDVSKVRSPFAVPVSGNHTVYLFREGDSM